MAHSGLIFVLKIMKAISGTGFELVGYLQYENITK